VSLDQGADRTIQAEQELRQLYRRAQNRITVVTAKSPDNLQRYSFVCTPSSIAMLCDSPPLVRINPESVSQRNILLRDHCAAVPFAAEPFLC